MNDSIDISQFRNVPAAVIRSGLQRVFVNRVKRARQNVRRVVVISPWITAGDRAATFLSLVQLIRTRCFPAYFITRQPATPEHLKAAEVLQATPTAELVYNENVHAKVFACCAPTPHAFALLGSANLTANSVNLYEIGLLVIGVGPGSRVVDELANFGLNHLRTRPESEVVKKIDVRSIRNAV